MIFVGAASRQALKYGGVAPGLGILAVLANLVTALIWLTLAFALSYKFQRYPAAYLALLIIVIHGVSASIGIMRQRGWR